MLAFVLFLKLLRKPGFANHVDICSRLPHRPHPGPHHSLRLQTCRILVRNLGFCLYSVFFKRKKLQVGFPVLVDVQFEKSHFCKSVWKLLLPSPWSYLRLFALASEVLLPVCGSFPKWKKNQPSSAKVKCLAWNKSMQFEQINAKHAYLQNSYLFIKRI